MSMNAVSANLNMGTALRIRHEAMKMNVSLSSYISDLIEEALEARDYQSLGMDIGDADIPTHATDPDFDPCIMTDTYTEPTGIIAWFRRTFGIGMGKTIGEGVFGADPDKIIDKGRFNNMVGTFGIGWACAIRDPDTSPATEEEVEFVMAHIRDRAMKADGDGIITMTIRREIADAVIEGINGYSGDATVAGKDFGEPASYDSKRGCWLSELVVAKNQTELDIFIKEY